MRSNTVICVRWKISGRIEHFVNLGKLFHYYSNGELGVDRTFLNRRDLFNSYENSTVQIIKTNIQ
jgi:hypothetical protein